ncbi:helix-turn-helix transcriptional regulator [Candidatus Bipolaricaulota bacterium]|nr:helix-turn-helix transcriptional regulator [Candidatus Bipolaricaulota bacterium]
MLNQQTAANVPEDVPRLCRALSVETRVRMLALLHQRSMCVGALARALGITDAAVSQHLRVLRDAKLVVAERRGHFVHYTINPDTVERWRHAVVGLLSVGDGHTSASSDCEMRRRGGER